MFYTLSSALPCSKKGEINQPSSSNKERLILLDGLVASVAALVFTYALLSLFGANLGPLNSLSASMGSRMKYLALGTGIVLAAELLGTLASTCKKAENWQKAHNELQEKMTHFENTDQAALIRTAELDKKIIKNNNIIISALKEANSQLDERLQNLSADHEKLLQKCEEDQQVIRKLFSGLPNTSQNQKPTETQS